MNTNECKICHGLGRVDAVYAPCPDCEPANDSRPAPCSRCFDLQEAIKLAVKKFEEVRWGWDGDCGSGRILDELEEILTENDQADTRHE